MDITEITKMAYITRMDYEKNSNSWWVRFVVTQNSKQTIVAHKLFKDWDYIDKKEEALFYAQEWRDYKYKELFNNGIIKGYQANYGFNIPPAYIHPRPDNKSGVTGVEKLDFYYLKTINEKKYNIHVFAWKATWVEYDIHKKEPRRRQRAKVFSINKHGDEDAFDMACEVRDEKVQYILAPHHIKLREEYQRQNKRR